MRIVLDMQGAQTQSRLRGIGRYTLAFARAVVEQSGDHEVHLVLNGLLDDSIDPIKEAFKDLLPLAHIHIWTAPSPVQLIHPNNALRYGAAEILREAFIEQLAPDVVHVTSLFEGYVGDAVTSIGAYDQRSHVSVTLYDLIPLLNREEYLSENPRYEQFYMQKVDCLRKAAINLAISDFSRAEAADLLSLEEERIVSKSSAADSHFQRLDINEEVCAGMLERLAIKRPFVLYTGGSDTRKNLLRLIEAYQSLPATVRQATQLVFVGRMSLDFLNDIKALRYDKDSIIFTDFVAEADLVALYNLCECFVFPSWHEGFGLPVLEAMSCGAVVVASNASSVPEVLGCREALFDPFDVEDIRDKLLSALCDERFRERMTAHALNQSKKFSWSETARVAIAAWESLLATTPATPRISDRLPNVPQSGQDLEAKMGAYCDAAQRFIRDIIAALDQHNVLPSSDEELLCLAEALHNNVMNLKFIESRQSPV